MRKADAPPAGWYPDPVGGARLRWWDGLDWTDHWGAPPAPAPSEFLPHGAAQEAVDHVAAPEPPSTGAPPSGPRARRDQTAEIMSEVRRATREEVDRAVDRLSDRATAATRQIQPMITQYGDRVLGWIRNLGILVVALVVLWIVFQTFAQTTLLQWLGDRIDSLTDSVVRIPVGRGAP